MLYEVITIIMPDMCPRVIHPCIYHPSALTGRPAAPLPSAFPLKLSALIRAINRKSIPITHHFFNTRYYTTTSSAVRLLWFS